MKNDNHCREIQAQVPEFAKAHRDHRPKHEKSGARTNGVTNRSVRPERCMEPETGIVSVAENAFRKVAPSIKPAHSDGEQFCIRAMVWMSGMSIRKMEPAMFDCERGILIE